jgi:hypothetical protein
MGVVAVTDFSGGQHHWLFCIYSIRHNLWILDPGCWLAAGFPGDLSKRVLIYFRYHQVKKHLAVALGKAIRLFQLSGLNLPLHSVSARPAADKFSATGLHQH